MKRENQREEEKEEKLVLSLSLRARTCRLLRENSRRKSGRTKKSKDGGRDRGSRVGRGGGGSGILVIERQIREQSW